MRNVQNVYYNKKTNKKRTNPSPFEEVEFVLL